MNPINPNVEPCKFGGEEHNFQLAVLNNLKDGILWCSKCGLQMQPNYFPLARDGTAA